MRVSHIFWCCELGLHMMSSATIEANSYVEMLVEPIMTLGVNLDPEKHVQVCAELAVCGAVPDPLRQLINDLSI